MKISKVHFRGRPADVLSLIIRVLIPLPLTCLVALSETLAATASVPQESALNFSPFGDVKIFRTPAVPKSLVMLISGHEGWTAALTDTAKAMAVDSVIVAGINGPAYLKHLDRSKAKCLYPSGELENLSKYIQAELRFTDYELPIVIGDGESASLIYGSFFQAPESTFMAALGWNFCPTYKTRKPICNGDGFRSEKTATNEKGFKILPTERSLAGWTTITGDRVSPCSLEAAESFTRAMKISNFQSAGGNGSKEVAASVAEILRKVPAQNLHAGGVENLTDLPLIILEPEKIRRGPGEFFAIFYSGDGGWAGFDKDLSAELNARGIPLVGLSTLSYFWKARPPETCAADLRKIIENFQKKWGIKNVALLGYSFGADVLPQLTTLLPDGVRKNVAQITLMSSSGFAEYEFHFGHWLSSDGTGGTPMLPSLQKLKGQVRVQCLYGSDEKKPYCTKLDHRSFDIVKLPGGHRFDGDQKKLADVIQRGFSANGAP